MKEDDYINATNLAKARIAESVIRSMLFMDNETDQKQKEIQRALIEIIENLEKKVVE